MELNTAIRRRIVFFVLAGCAFLVTEFGRFRYRPWVRANDIDDFGLADSIGNLGGILVQIFFVLAVVGGTRRKSFIMATGMAVGYVIYEFAQPYLPKGTFDWGDVLATGIGYVVAMPVVWLVWRATDRPTC